MNTIRFKLNISEDQLLKYYRGHARNVVVQDSKGMNVSFPVDAIRPFVLQGGVRGYFEMIVDDNNKLIELKKVANC